MVKFIIEKPIDHNLVNMNSALNFAAFYGKLEVLKYLVDLIGFSNVLNGEREDPLGVGYISPLYYGVCGGHLEVVKFFFRHYFPQSRTLATLEIYPYFFPVFDLTSYFLANVAGYEEIFDYLHEHETICMSQLPPVF